jgi:GT2 family glycosyltransferase
MANVNQKVAVLPKVSLIISNFNGKDMLRDCLNSLNKLDYPNYEIIVVDAASTDGTPEMIKSEFITVILIEGKERFGIGEAINIGISKAKGEIIAFDLNNDEVFSENWLKILVKELESTDDKKVVGGIRLIYGSDGFIDAAGGKINFLGEGTLINKFKHISDVSINLEEIDVLGCPVFYSTLLDEIGLCDEKYYFFYEDSDFCERAKQIGYKIINVYSAISYHRRSATVGAQSPKSYYYLRRNRLRFIIKHFAPIRLLIASLYWLLLMIVEGLIFFPLTQKFLIYIGVLKIKYDPEYFNASINAVHWNIRNIKYHFNARMEQKINLDRWKKRQVC